MTSASVRLSLSLLSAVICVMAGLAVGGPFSGESSSQAMARAANASQLRAGTDEVRSLLASSRSASGTAREVYTKRIESVASSIRDLSGTIDDQPLSAVVSRLPVTAPELRQEATQRVLDEVGAHADRIAAQEKLAAQVAASNVRRMNTSLGIAFQAGALVSLLVGLAFFMQFVRQTAIERSRLAELLPRSARDEDLPSRAARLVGRADRLAERHDRVVMQNLSVTQALGAYLEAEANLHHAQDELRASLVDARDEVERLKVSAMLDELTGALKYPYLVHRVGELLSDYFREQVPFCLLELDLDNFKDINDTFGHAAGDDALRDFAKLMQMTCGSNYLVVRKSGDEFFVLAPNASLETAIELGERLRAAVNTHQVVSTTIGGDRYEFPLAVSIGVLDPSTADLAPLREVSDPDLAVRELISYVDAALYRAKHAGRDCVRSYESGMRVVDVGNSELPSELSRINRLAKGRYARLSDDARSRLDSLLGEASNLLFPKRPGA